jgi:hypothetical protein
VPATVYDAQDHDIWPDPADRPPPAMREEIRRIARDEVTAEDVEASGLTFAPWFCRFYLAQGIVRARMDAAKTEPKVEPRPAPASEFAELQALRKRIAKLEQGLLTENGWFIKAVGTALGEVHGELEGRLKTLEDREPVPVPLPMLDQQDRPVLRYAGLWNTAKSYGPGDLVTCNGAGWIAMSAMAAGVKPGDGPTGWRLAVKSDTASVRSIVRDEVRKQLRERT